MSTIAADNALEFTQVQSKLRSYTGSALTRLRTQAALDSAAVALTVSAWLLVLLVFADKLFSLSNLGVNIWVVWGGVSLLGIPFVIWRTFSPSLHERRAAILADDRLGLHARLSSALTLDFSDPANAHFSGAFLNEAMGKMAAIRVQHAFPIRIPRALAWLLLPAAFAAGIFYLMKPQDVLGIVTKAEAKRKAEERKQAAAENLKGTLEDLKEKAKNEKGGDEKSGNFKVNQAIKDAQNVAKDLKDGTRDSEEALLKLGSIKKDLEDEKEKIQRGKEFSERLEKIQAKDLNLEETDSTKAVSEALKLGDVGMAAKELRKAAQKIKDEVLNNDKLSPEEKQKKMEQIKKEMEKLAGALAEDEALRDKLQEIAQSSMSAAEYQKLSDEMKKADERQNKGNKKFGDEIERQMEQAADELERLEEENDSKLNEEEQKEMDEIDKVEDSLDQAMEGLSGENQGEGEGKEAQHKGGGKSGGDKPGKQSGGKSGGKMRSMSGKSGRQGGKQGGGDGKQKGGGEKGDGDKGQNPNGQPGNGLGGGPGQGSRPYQDGDAQFKSEKVQGELRAGAITGISHFRGQGAKGNAPESFYKTFEPESKDGASSLELERVPAEAREMVKDYFTRVRDGANEAKTPPNSPPAPTPGPKAPDGPSKEGLKE